MREKSRAEPGIHRTDLRPNLSEDRVIRRDREIAECAHYVAAAYGKASHFGDHRFWYFPQTGVDLLDRNADDTPLVALGFPVADLIATGAERLATRPCQHDRTDIRIPSGILQRLQNLEIGLHPEGVHALRTVEGDVSSVVALFINDVFVCHRSTHLAVHRQAAGDTDRLSGDIARVIAR